MSIAESLRTAKALLTEETWRKGNYFSADGDTLCMCAHGAVQAVVNDMVGSTICRWIDVPKGAIKASYAASDAAEESEAAHAADVARTAARLASCASPTATAAHAAGVVSLQAAEVVYLSLDLADRAEAAEAAGEAARDARLASRDAVTPDLHLPVAGHWTMTPRLGHGAHYVMGLVGLTASYNDKESTTLDDVMRKFDDAIALAERLEAAP